MKDKDLRLTNPSVTVLRERGLPSVVAGRDRGHRPRGGLLQSFCHPQFAATSAFTLIELLVAVTVLVVITLLLARIISQSNDIISDGARQATQNANARMALDFLAREFAQAGGDGRLHFQRDETPGSPAVPSTYGSSFPCHQLKFVTFKNLLEPSGTSTNREAVRVAYYVKSDGGTNSLVRAEEAIAGTGSYPTYLTPAEEVELMRYVVEFRAVCHDTNATASIMNSMDQDHLPAYIDVYLSVLSESEAKRAATFVLGSANQKDYVVRNAKRYYTRCWSLNRSAYINGR